jgi:phage shock protein A
LARAALQRKQASLAEAARLSQQAAELTDEERKLSLAEQGFAQRVDAFRTRRTSLAARYSAAEAQVRVAEAVSGISAEAAELGQALERTEDKIGRMQARAAALDALLENGSLSTPDGADALQRELDDLAAAQKVEEELAALKAQISP